MVRSPAHVIHGAKEVLKLFAEQVFVRLSFFFTVYCLLDQPSFKISLLFIIMRIAICISGQLRYYKKALHLFGAIRFLVRTKKNLHMDVHGFAAAL